MADVPSPASGPVTRKVHDGARHPRLARELKTIRAMARIYCRKHHGTGAGDGLCVECAALLSYATRRLDRCVFGDDKPTCANCTVHCYSESMRVDARAVMRCAGPRMLWRHPVLAIAHLHDGRRPSRDLPTPHRTKSEAAAEGRRSSYREDSDPGPV